VLISFEISSQIDETVKLVSQINQDLFVQCVAKILNIINPNENLAIQLPPNTGAKYRICTKFSNLCQVNVFLKICMS
jgi:hypothetical protein